MTIDHLQLTIIVDSIIEYRILLYEMLYLVVHTLTITECDFVLRAQFLHALGRIVAGRFSLRVLQRSSKKATLRRLRMPCLKKTLMKANNRRIGSVRHHLRTIKITSQNFQNLEEKHLVSLSPASSSHSERQTQEVDTSFSFDSNNCLTPTSNPQQTAHWLTANRFDKYMQTFVNFSGADMLRMTRDDFIQICGHADGIRLHNALHSKPIAPKLTIYVCKDNSSIFNAIFLTSTHNHELLGKLSAFLNVQQDQIKDMYLLGPQMIHVQINSNLIKHLKDESMYNADVLNENGSLMILLKCVNNNK